MNHKPLTTAPLVANAEYYIRQAISAIALEVARKKALNDSIDELQAEITALDVIRRRLWATR